MQINIFSIILNIQGNFDHYKSSIVNYFNAQKNSLQNKLFQMIHLQWYIHNSYIHLSTIALNRLQKSSNIFSLIYQLQNFTHQSQENTTKPHSVRFWFIQI